MTEASGPSSAVVDAVAAEAGVDPSELPPLYESVDPDALDALFAPRADGTARPSGSISITYAGFVVTVEPEGAVEVVELED